MKNTDGSKQTIDLGENTCIVNVGSASTDGGVYAYLVIGFAQGKAKGDSESGKRLSWKNVDKNFLVKGYDCSKLPWSQRGKLKLRTDCSWAAGNSNWFAREYSMIVFGTEGGIVRVDGTEENSIVAVVLGLFVDRVTVAEAEWGGQN